MCALCIPHVVIFGTVIVIFIVLIVYHVVSWLLPLSLSSFFVFPSSPSPHGHSLCSYPNHASMSQIQTHFIYHDVLTWDTLGCSTSHSRTSHWQPFNTCIYTQSNNQRGFGGRLYTCLELKVYFLSMPNTNSALFNNLQQKHVKYLIYFTKIKFAIQMLFSWFQLPNNKNI